MPSAKAEFVDLIDRLGSAALECRELIREAHAATKNLRQAAKEARAEIAAAVETEWDERVGAEVKDHLARYSKTLDAAIESGTQAVFRRFDTLTEILMGEEKNQRRQGLPSIPEFIERKAGLS